jgi:hypothetical protein
MTRYVMRGRPLGDTVLAGYAIGDEFDANLDPDTEQQLVGSGAIAPASETPEPQPEPEQQPEPDEQPDEEEPDEDEQPDEQPELEPAKAKAKNAPTKTKTAAKRNRAQSTVRRR